MPMMYDSSSTHMFRDRTHAGAAPYVLRRKKCACGKEVTAKQLAQYGRCARCVQSAAAARQAAAA